jgi:hypothetical protein
VTGTLLEQIGVAVWGVDPNGDDWLLTAYGVWNHHQHQWWHLGEIESRLTVLAALDDRLRAVYQGDECSPAGIPRPLYLVKEG